MCEAQWCIEKACEEKDCKLRATRVHVIELEEALENERFVNSIIDSDEEEISMLGEKEEDCAEDEISAEDKDVDWEEVKRTLLSQDKKTRSLEEEIVCVEKKLSRNSLK